MGSRGISVNINERQRKWLVLGVSIALGCCSAATINTYLSNKTTELEHRNSVEYVLLLVASKDLKRDTVIGADDLHERIFQANGIAQDVLYSHEIDSVVGKRLTTDLQAGVWLLGSALTDPVVPTLSERLDPALRAVTLPVDSVNAMSGLLKPGDRVDLFVSFDHEGKRVTALLLGAIEVLATDQHTRDVNVREGALESGYSTITVAVSPADSIRLIAARQSGVISAVMSARHANTPQHLSESIAINLEEMLGLVRTGSVDTATVIYGDRLEGLAESLENGYQHSVEGSADVTEKRR
jgi:pilus assembly protein CpaB